jgi:predicted ArsR family transcriptional regulator
MPDATLSAAAMRVLKLLVGNRPQTVAQLMAAAGVTRTAVTEQLNELVAGGFVERRSERLPGRGRPRHLFSTTEAALFLLFANSQRILVPNIWRAIGEVGGDKLVRDVMKRVSKSLADHYIKRVKGSEPEQRLQHLVQVMVEEGALVEAVEEDDRLVLYRRSCPFVAMVDDQRAVCSVDLDMMSAVVGKPVRRIACRHAGDPCCSFTIAEQNGR